MLLLLSFPTQMEDDAPQIYQSGPSGLVPDLAPGGGMLKAENSVTSQSLSCLPYSQTPHIPWEANIGLHGENMSSRACDLHPT